MRRSRRSLRRTLGYSAVALAVLVAGAAVFYFIYRTPSTSSTSSERTVTVTRGTVQATVSASGNISTVSSADENFVTSGTLKSLDVTVGQEVQAGQVLASIDATQATSSRQSAQITLTVAKKNYNLARRALNNQTRNLAQARAQLATDEAGGTTTQKNQSQQSLDSAQQQLVNDQNQLANDQAQLTTDQQALATANATYSADELLGCPPASAGKSGAATPGTIIPSVGSAPSVATTGASAISTTTAQLNASINPNGAQTTYYFMYGTSTSYGLSSVAYVMAAGDQTQQVSISISGLSPNTTYLFNVEALSANGVSLGQPTTLTTAEDDCTAQTAIITADQTKITADQQKIASDQTAITVQNLSVQDAQANMSPSSSTIKADKSAIVQDQAGIAQAKVGLIQNRNGISQDETALAQANTTVANTRLVALMSGTVTSVNGTVGQSVSGGGSTTVSGSSSSSSSSSSGSGSSGSSSALVTITGLHQLEVVADFAEADAVKLALHQKATITLPASTSSVVNGVVTAISPISTTSSGVVSYPVTIALVKPPTTAKDGMTAEVSVIVQTATNVLELPSAAITTNGSTSTVQVMSKGVAHTTSVTLGVVGGTYTEIKSGVSEGESVVEPQASVSASTSTSSSSSSGGFGGRLGGGFNARFGGG